MSKLEFAQQMAGTTAIVVSTLNFSLIERHERPLMFKVLFPEDIVNQKYPQGELQNAARGQT